jgi:aromatase
MPATSTHRTTVAAPAQAVYALIADVTRWPWIFPPTVHAEATRLTDTEEQIRLWATAGGTVKHWTSRRRHDPAARRVVFWQEVPQHPVAAMSGTWSVTAVDGAGTLVTLDHAWRAAGDDPENLAWIERAVDANSQSELAALKSVAEAQDSDLVLSFTDSLNVAGSPADLYDFIDEADRWATRVPHVARVELTEDTPGIQLLAMDTRTADGATHATESYRVCLAPDRIVYKQVKVPALMTAHTGAWEFAARPDGATITSAHTVVLNPATIEGVLGPGATVATAREYVRAALTGNSRTTMQYAKDYAEGISDGTAGHDAIGAEH